MKIHQGTVILNNPFSPIKGLHIRYPYSLSYISYISSGFGAFLFKQAIAAIIIHQFIYLVHSWSKYNKITENAQGMYSKWYSPICNLTSTTIKVFI